MVWFKTKPNCFYRSEKPNRTIIVKHKLNRMDIFKMSILVNYDKKMVEYTLKCKLIKIL
jgi:hypothetical protein